MEEELDQILLDQYHIHKGLGKKMVTAKKLMGDDPLLLEFQKLNEKRTKFFENMINDKTILSKKKRKTKKKYDDLLARHPLVDVYKYTWMSTYYGYSMMIESIRNYISFFKKR